MKLATPSEMRKIEARTIAELSISEEQLMERAGESAAFFIRKRYPQARKVLIVCGPGHNGGDGLVVARFLSRAAERSAGQSTDQSTDQSTNRFSSLSPDCRVELLLLEPIGNCKPLVQKQFDKLKDLPIDVIGLADLDFSKVDVVVDALYGIGLDRPLQGGKIEALIQKLNECGQPIVSLDCPSGLNCATGVVGGAGIRASLTLTFGLAKVGFFTPDGKRHSGEGVVLPMGFPAQIVTFEASSTQLITEKIAARLLPDRPLKSNKTNFGNVVVCAGQPGYWGAGVLSTQAAFRVGAGYVTWASEKTPLSELKSHPEVLTCSLREVFSAARRTAAFVVGPGLGTDKATELLLQELIHHHSVPAVIDADALTVIASKGISSLPKKWVLTPHAGELSRLLAVSAAEIEANRFFYARLAAKKYGCLVLLKGYRSLLAAGEKLYVIDSGNPALAKAGTGDVLAGFIGGFMAQGLSSLRAAVLGAYVHGRVADEWVKSGKDVASLVATDLVHDLPNLLSLLRAHKVGR
jgi:NAD(P)H-hydrate epimerase